MCPKTRAKQMEQEGGGGGKGDERWVARLSVSKQE